MPKLLHSSLAFILISALCFCAEENEVDYFKLSSIYKMKGNFEDTIISCVELKEWYQKAPSDISDSKKIETFIFSASHKPWQLMGCNECGGKLTDSVFAIKRQELSDLIYFEVSISCENKNLLPSRINIEESELSNRLEYLSYDMQANFKLISGADTFDCVLYHYQPGVIPSGTDKLLLAFSRENNLAENISILFDDVVFTQKKNLVQSFRKNNH